MTPLIRNILKILLKREEIAPQEQFLLFSTIVCNLILDFCVKTRTRFILRDKRLFEITEVEITRVDCNNADDEVDSLDAYVHVRECRKFIICLQIFNFQKVQTPLFLYLCCNEINDILRQNIMYMWTSFIPTLLAISAFSCTPEFLFFLFQSVNEEVKSEGTNMAGPTKQDENVS